MGKDFVCVAAGAMAAAVAVAAAVPAAAATRHSLHHQLYFVEYTPPAAYWASAATRRYPRHQFYRAAYTPSEAYLAAPPLTIRKRSFLDAGVVVPVGSASAYVAESTTLGAPYVVRDLLHQRYDAWRADKLSIPGNPEPLFQFETPGAPD